jgi:hypothetical protein
MERSFTVLVQTFTVALVALYRYQMERKLQRERNRMLRLPRA